jgi:hypothetical protein
MNATTGNTQQFRRIAVIMFLVLLASVGLAWWLVGTRDAAARRGADILVALRHDGLDKFWTQPQSVEWTLLRVNGKEIGWRAHVVNKTPDGFEGTELFVTYQEKSGQTQAAGKWEKWLLNNDATAGDYSAGVLGGGRRIIIKPDTTIRFANGKIAVQQEIEGALLQSSVAAPPNYLVEGTMRPVMLLVAQKKVSAVFELVFNEMPPTGAVTSLGAIAVHYEGGGGEVTGAKYRVGVNRPGMGKSHETVHYLDETGRTVRIEGEESEEVSVTRDEILKRYPDAQKFVDTLAPKVRAEPASTSAGTNTNEPL